MGFCIISSDQQFDEMLKRLGPKSYALHIIVSDDLYEKIIKSVNLKHRIKNFMDGRILIPPPNIIAKFQETGNIEEYRKEYVNYLRTPKVASYLTSYMKLAFETHVVLICNSAEKPLKYMEILKWYLQQEVGFGEYCKRYRRYVRRNLEHLNKRLNAETELKLKVMSMYEMALNKAVEAEIFKV